MKVSKNKQRNMNKNQFKHDEESKDPIFVLDIKILKQKYFIRECQY